MPTAHLADKLHYLREVFLFGQDLLHLSSQIDEFGEVLLVVVIEGADVLGV